MTKSVVVITRFALRGVSKDSNDNKSYTPDIVKWNNDFFVVIHVEDWSNYARGFVKATCTSIDSVDQATTAKPFTPQNVRVSD